MKRLSKCPKCNSKDIILSGKVKDKQRYQCKTCNRFFSTITKSNSISQKKINELYRLYSQNNYSLAKIARLGKISHVTFYKWFRSDYWTTVDISNNIFSKVAENSEYVKDILFHFRNVKSVIRVKPLAEKVIIEYIDNEKSTNLFTLKHIRYKEGDILCSVTFDILNILKNKVNAYSTTKERIELQNKGESTFTEIYIDDFINYDLILNEDKKLNKYSKRIKLENSLNNVYISNFLDFIAEPSNITFSITLAKKAIIRAKKNKNDHEFKTEDSLKKKEIINKIIENRKCN